MQRVTRGINGLFVNFSVDVIPDLDRQTRSVGVMPVPKLRRKFLAVQYYFLISSHGSIHASRVWPTDHPFAASRISM
jgi:hypothetical protein